MMCKEEREILEKAVKAAWPYKTGDGVAEHFAHALPEILFNMGYWVNICPHLRD